MTTDVPSSESASPTERLGSGAMFDEIAERYDFLNRVLSMGIDHGWRRKTVQALIDSEGTEPKRVLDLATGTADLALAVAKRFPEAKVTGSDPSRNMLAIGEKKVAQAGAKVTLESLVPGFKGHSWSTVIWLNDFRIRLGETSFSTHAGTRRTVSATPGQLTYYTDVNERVVQPPD